jgi:hypothetical protein
MSGLGIGKPVGKRFSRILTRKGGRGGGVNGIFPRRHGSHGPDVII